MTVTSAVWSEIELSHAWQQMTNNYRYLKFIVMTPIIRRHAAPMTNTICDSSYDSQYTTLIIESVTLIYEAHFMVAL